MSCWMSWAACVSCRQLWPKLGVFIDSNLGNTFMRSFIHSFALMNDNQNRTRVAVCQGVNHHNQSIVFLMIGRANLSFWIMITNTHRLTNSLPRSPPDSSTDHLGRSSHWFSCPKWKWSTGKPLRPKAWPTQTFDWLTFNGSHFCIVFCFIHLYCFVIWSSICIFRLRVKGAQDHCANWQVCVLSFPLDTRARHWLIFGDTQQANWSAYEIC